MDELITQERREQIVAMFASVAEFMTNADAVEVIDIMLKVCTRAKVDISEAILKFQIEGPTPGAPEEN